MSTQPKRGPATWQALVFVWTLAAASVIVTGQITVPNTFTNHTVADAPQVNANFNALASNALNRTGGTMTGPLNSRDVIPTADNTYDGGSATFAFRDLYVKRNTIFNTIAYTWPAAQSAGYVLATNGSGALSWVNANTSLDPCGLRLTLTSGTPVTTADVLAATSVYVTPVKGGQCAFHDGSATWTLLTNAEVTVAVPATTSTPFDVFCYNNAGVMGCEALSWTNDTTRATALTLQNNVYVKTGATTRRFIGTSRTTAVSGQTEDSETKRFVWNYYNRARRSLLRIDGTANWIYTTATWRQANAGAGTANKVEAVVGVAEGLVDLRVQVQVNNSGGSAVAVGIGIDSLTVPSTRQIGGPVSPVASGASPAWAMVNSAPAIGYHYFAWLEFSTASGTTTWYSDNVINDNSGLSGWIEG